MLKKDGNSLGWSNLTWTSSNEKVVKVGNASGYDGDYKVTIYKTAVPTPVILTATLKCNSVDGVSVTKSFDIIVAAGTGSDTVRRPCGSGWTLALQRSACAIGSPARS